MTPPLDTAVFPDADRLPLDAIDVRNPAIYQEDVWQRYFARLRREDPVHYCPASPYGPYWAVTKYKDIMQVEVNHQVYSSASELDGIQIEEQPKNMDRPSFIRMDPPKHDEQRKVVSPVVAPANLWKG
jgi:cytochrome P450